MARMLILDGDVCRLVRAGWHATRR